MKHNWNVSDDKASALMSEGVRLVGKFTDSRTEKSSHFEELEICPIFQNYLPIAVKQRNLLFEKKAN